MIILLLLATFPKALPQTNPVMNTPEIVNRPIQFRVYGLIAEVEDRNYSKAGLVLMNRLWHIVAQEKILTTGQNHWVYFNDNRMMAGITLPDRVPEPACQALTRLDIEHCRYLKYIHIGRYDLLPMIWKELIASLESRGECVEFPSLEVYGHHCEQDYQLETTIILGLKEQH